MTEYQLAAMSRVGEHGEPIFRAPSVGCSGKKPVISVEDSLRTRLRWSQEKVEQLEEENRRLRGRLPGPSFDDLIAAASSSKKQGETS